jgi:hypothetical protein
MSYQYEATALLLEHSDEQRRAPAVLPEAVSRARPEPSQMCVVCRRVPARLTLKVTSSEDSQFRPPRLCLRCHHAVMQQRRMMRMRRSERRAKDPQLTFGNGLIVPRSSGLTGDSKYDRLVKARRRAQKAARFATDPDDVEVKCAVNF